MKIGQCYKIIKQSTKFNPHIRSVGYIGLVEEFNEDAVQLEIFWDSVNNCYIKCMGAVDIDCIEKLSMDDLTFNQQCCMSQCYTFKPA